MASSFCGVARTAWWNSKAGWTVRRLIIRPAVAVAAFPKPCKAPPADYAPGARNETLNKRVFKAAVAGRPDAVEAEKAAAVAAGLPADEAERTAASAAAAGGEQKQRVFKRCARRALQGGFAALEIEARKDVRASAYQVKPKGGDWQNLEDESAEHFRALLSERFLYQRSDEKLVPLQFGKDAFWSALLSLAGESPEKWLVDPFLVYIESLPAWDQKPRIHNLLDRALGVVQDGLGIWASRYLFLGPLQRAYRPGCELKESPVLCGAQRLGKSPLINALFPESQRGAWFGDTLRFSDKAQQMVESCLGRVLVEYAELSAVGIKDNEAMKSYLSRRIDNGVRLAYARLPVILPRRYAIVFTSNKKNPLPNDPSGNSRYVPVQCSHGADMDALVDSERKQLWAEGLYRYRQGERANLPRDLYEAQERACETSRSKDPALEDKLAEIPDGTLLQLDELALRCGLHTPLTKGDQYRLVDALENGRWENCHFMIGNRWVRGAK